MVVENVTEPKFVGQQAYTLEIDDEEYPINLDDENDLLVGIIRQNIDVRVLELGRLYRNIEKFRVPKIHNEKFRRSQVRRKASNIRDIHNAAEARRYALMQMGSRIKTLEIELSVLKGKKFGDIHFIKDNKDVITGVSLNLELDKGSL